jgi:hypothetical protein
MAELVLVPVGNSRPYLAAVSKEATAARILTPKSSTPAMETAMSMSLYSKQAVINFQTKVIEATLEAGEPIMEVEQIQQLKTLPELNRYLVEQMEVILTELAIL